MIALLARHPKYAAWCLATLFYIDLVLSPVVARGGQPVAPVVAPLPHNAWLTGKKMNALPKREPLQQAGQAVAAINKPAHSYQPFTTGPGQPEMAAFTSVNSANMVDLFTGDFSYNIPLLDVGGYPVNIAYRGGISMDQEASWVGLGWNINPGTITRNMRGLPDDFNGESDSVRKTTSIKENKTIGVTGGADVELVGLPLNAGASLGVVHNNYRGWGIEHAVNASINSGIGAAGSLTSGLSITNSSQNGLTVAPSLSVNLAIKDAEEKSVSGSFSVSAPYNTRSGLKGLQLSSGIRQYVSDATNQRRLFDIGTGISSEISFASPSYTPSITIPYTSRQFSFTGKVGLLQKLNHPSFFISGYVSKQRIDSVDRVLSLPAYGYLYYQDGALNRSALLDFNREKEIPYREKPAVAHIAVPQYTYDAFSITGEGTGGMFRAYRGDIGFVYDHYIRTRDESDRASVDIGVQDIVHAGVDLNINRAFTQNGPWLNQNTLRQVIDFRQSSNDFQSAYFRNPGEKSINSKAFYDAIGGDDVVTVGLAQSGTSGSTIQTTNFLTRYRNKRKTGTSQLTLQNAIKPERDKRTQVISYLTAKEADAAALQKYIEDYTVNQFLPDSCEYNLTDDYEGEGIGLPSFYYDNRELKEPPAVVLWFDTALKLTPNRSAPPHAPSVGADHFSVRWEGRLKAPETGTYILKLETDDGTRVWINDELIIDKWRDQPVTTYFDTLNLVGGEYHKIKVEFYERTAVAVLYMYWQKPGDADFTPIPSKNLFPPAVDHFQYDNHLVKEKRVNRFRRENHISEITVLNNDGRRYVYGIPVYNLKQKEATFSIDGKNRGNMQTGLSGYQYGRDNSPLNRQGKDWYFNSEEVPAYAHSFLLTGILSADYSDITGNGISPDDIGDAVKFKYSKVCGIDNPFKWRAPNIDSVTFNEGLKTDYRDDKGNYVYGEKELWYLHSIESKTMIATFVLENRSDLQQINERGIKANDGSAKRLKEINLYSKSDFARKGLAARPIKTVHFEYTYDLCPGINGTSDGRLTLKKIWFTYDGNDKGKQNPYLFNYNTKNPAYNSKSYDRWGNYKDPLQNPGSVTGDIITNAEYPYALQDSAAAAQNAAAWLLDSVFLPSGGSIKVKYESDDYAYVQNKRAMQLFKIAGLNSTSSLPAVPDRLYRKLGNGNWQDNLYVFINVPKAVSSVQQVYQYYLTGIEKLYFRFFVNVPTDPYGSGHEYVSCYADLSAAGGYGLANSTTIWVKLAGISLEGDGPGNYSPLTKAATQFLRLNLPSKAYPGSETGDNMDLREAVDMLASLADNIKNAFKSFDRIARNNVWCAKIDTGRSYVRLNNPYYKKYGGGHRVKRITIYDNWDRMTNQRAAIYGQEYTYTVKKPINGDSVIISSGVASYEPGLGGEENPFHEPIEYVEKISPLGPVTLGYTEEPLGESFFPAAGIGYSNVRVRTINYKDKKSANGYEETKFYTAYDFPVYTDRSMLDNDTKKRYKPDLRNFLRVNARHYLALSQGFKIELNDMHGKLRSKASYAETDPVNPVSFSENIYKVENRDMEFKRLSNTVMVMKPDGSIDSAALIGKDAELMMDMREQLSVTNGANINLNVDVFSIPAVPPFFIVPSFYYMGQREETIFRSAATVKIIQRYGILDSAIQVDKGSKISTKDILYDSETGDVLLTRTQNEFNDPVYNFTYPSHWAYEGMGLAYKNIDVTVQHVNIINGKISNTLSKPDSALFFGGDEILVAGKQKTTDVLGCVDSFATFPNYTKVWAIDSSVLTGGTKSFYFVDRKGKPYSGHDVSLRVVRSGRRNILAAVGAVTSLDSLVKRNSGTGEYELVMNTASKIISASAGEFKQFWKVEDILAKERLQNCLPLWQSDSAINCLKDSTGTNTGYLEIRQRDINPLSPSFNATRWKFMGKVCMICAMPAKWTAPDSTRIRCATDSLGNNTGYLELEETDTAACSNTYNSTRWVTILFNCTTCPKPPKWVPDDTTRCVIDDSVAYTGHEELRERDTATCSATYNTTRWVATGDSCTVCSTEAQWTATFTYRCALDGSGNNTGYEERQEIDTNPCSPTYNTTRWVLLIAEGVKCFICPTTNANWTPTGNTMCELVGPKPFHNSGWVLREEIDAASCSSTSGQTRWERFVYDTDVCPLSGSSSFDASATGALKNAPAFETIKNNFKKNATWLVIPESKQ